MDISNFKMTEEKVKKLKPIFEQILSRKYGEKIEFSSLTVGNITVTNEKSRTHDK
jgi:hypothetical protein